jgi:hypothetical protein
MSNNDRIYNPVTPALGSVFYPDATAPTGVSAAQVDHTTLLNKGTNTHVQIDAFVASKGQANGLATLDGTGNVPVSQLGNACAPPVTKGVIITGDGTASKNLPPGATNQLLTADTSATNGIKWAQGDHTTLANIGTNTHAQLDAFVASKGAANGLASLDASSFVPVPQLGNLGSTTPVATLLNIVRPWTESGWASDLNALKSTGTLVPVYSRSRTRAPCRSSSIPATARSCRSTEDTTWSPARTPS